jgi:hypothetical protein
MSLIDINIFDNPIGLIKKLGFVEFDNTLLNFESNSISIALKIDEFETVKSGLLIEEHIFSLLTNEINQSIYKKITKELLDTVKFDYIDLNKFNQMEVERTIVDKIIENRSDYYSLISSSIVSSELSHVNGFNSSPITNTYNMIYHTGNLMGIDMYVDPYMRYNDGRICLLDKVRININNFEFSSNKSPITSTPRAEIKYDLSIDIGDSKIIFLIGGDFENTSEHLKKLQRDIKLNSLLYDK